MKLDKNGISVIIPTTCEARRSLSLLRTIQSLETQDLPNKEIIVVVNGDRYDPSLLERIKKDVSMSVIQLLEGNVSQARYVGICLVKNDLVCFLDDDDEYLPGSLSTRMLLANANPTADVIVTNGLHNNGVDLLLVPDSVGNEINTFPEKAFFESNWFASPSATFRKSRVGTSIFNFTLKYYEWTQLFFLLLIAKKKIFYSPETTYRVNLKSDANSASKSYSYEDYYPEFLKQAMDLDVSAFVKQSLKVKYIAALNTSSQNARARRWIKKSWRMHVLCIKSGGFNYLFYTRYLVLDLAMALTSKFIGERSSFAGSTRLNTSDQIKTLPLNDNTI